MPGYPQPTEKMREKSEKSCHTKGHTSVPDPLRAPAPAPAPAPPLPSPPGARRAFFAALFAACVRFLFFAAACRAANPGKLCLKNSPYFLILSMLATCFCAWAVLALWCS
jgi:hypothetical protein